MKNLLKIYFVNLRKINFLFLDHKSNREIHEFGLFYFLFFLYIFLVNDVNRFEKLENTWQTLSD